MKITEILTEQGMAKSDDKRGLDHAYEIYGNEHGYFVWRKSPLSKVLSVNHTDPEWSPSSDWTGFMDYSPRHPNIQDYVKTHMKPASFNSLPPNIKKNIVSQLPPKIPKDDSFRLPNWKDGTRPLSPWDYSEENPVTQRNMAIKQRLQSNPMAGPKSQLPEQTVAEGDYPDGSSIRLPSVDEYKKLFQQAMLAVKNAKTSQEYEAASERAGQIKDLLASKGVQVGPILGKQGVAEGPGTVDINTPGR